jgi:processive 1,2-diacylglycerol beta-glucosyltransferase
MRVRPFHVLVSGGNLGVGPIERMFYSTTSFSGKIKYFVLCGKNQNLFNKIAQLKNPVIEPISYINSRSEMNRLYEQMDLVLTKPGGITVSECLRKEIPLCLLDALPGQEEKNEQYLLEEKLAFKIRPQELEKNLLLFLEDEKARQVFQKRVSSYTDRLENLNTVIKNFLDR